MVPSTRILALVITTLMAPRYLCAFVAQRIGVQTAAKQTIEFTLFMAKGTKSKKKKGKAASGLKGFGSPATSLSVDVDTDQSREARAFYDYLDKGGAGDNLSRCALAYFPIQDGVRLRGVVALRDIRKGDPIIRIPYELAVNLGEEGADPTVPAVVFLRDYVTTMSSNEGSKLAAYYRMLPPFRSYDCLGSTDFFSEEALDALQSPAVAEETRLRKKLTGLRFEREMDFPSFLDGSPMTEEHLRWAVWLITSRVLTVQGAEEEGRAFRLLIPFLDMCNHDRQSPHVLSGRAVPGGELKVIAGANVRAGDQVNVCYGGGQAGNDRFIQDYGFLDYSKDEMAFKMVAQQLLGKRRILEGAGAGRLMTEPDRLETIALLESTTLEQDEAKLAALDAESIDMSTAVRYRIGVKKALRALSES